MNEELRNEIVSLRSKRTSIRSIAGKLAISRNTVRSVLRRVEKERSGGVVHPDLLPPARRRSCLDPYEDTIKKLLEHYPDITAQRVLEELREEDFPGSYTIVKDRVRELRPRPVKEPVERFETKAGKQAQMDYSPYTIRFTEEGLRRVHLFSYILGYSRRRYHRWVESENFATTVREHVRAFTYLGGLAEVCLYDGMKVVVLRYEDEEPIYNPRFLAFCTHYGYRPWACKRRRAKTKGKVERPFYFVQTSLLNGRTFRSLAHLNEATEWWLANVADARPNRTTKRPPIELFEEEREHLLPLPVHDYDTAEVGYRVVNAEGALHYLSNFYSVPWQYIGALVPVKITERELVVYSPKIVEIARHELFPRSVTGKRATAKAHLPGEDLRKKYEILKSRYQELGSVGIRFLEGIVAKRRYGKDEASKVLVLLGTYHRSDFVAALERAVRFGAHSMKAVERILAAQAVPKTPIEALGEKASRRISEYLRQVPVLPRPTKDYEALYGEGTYGETPPEGS
jgi:transposase